MNAPTPLPSRRDEAYRYSDIAALGEVWAGLEKPQAIRIGAGEAGSEVWLAGEQDIEVRRATIEVGAGGRFTLHALNAARRYGRIELDVTLREGADFAFHAANIGSGAATLEIVTTVRHLEPGAVSRQVVRSVVGGKATASYLGKVAVAREGQQTDSEQSVKAMLLDRGATANAKPELEIYADDVKCAHGATVGELDANQLFYAAARGMPPASAKALLLEGFVGGLWDGLGDESAVREQATRLLKAVTA